MRADGRRLDSQSRLIARRAKSDSQSGGRQSESRLQANGRRLDSQSQTVARRSESASQTRTVGQLSDSDSDSRLQADARASASGGCRRAHPVHRLQPQARAPCTKPLPPLQNFPRAAWLRQLRPSRAVPAAFPRLRAEVADAAMTAQVLARHAPQNPRAPSVNDADARYAVQRGAV